MPRIAPRGNSLSTKCIVDDFDQAGSSTIINEAFDKQLKSAAHGLKGSHKSRIFPSTRFFMAILLMLCFIALAVSTSNLSVSMVCMIKKDSDLPENIVNDLIRIRRSTNNSLIEEYLDQELGAIANLTHFNPDHNETYSLTKCELARLRKRAIEFESNPQLLEEVIENESNGDGLRIEVKTCHVGAALVEWSGTEQGLFFYQVWIAPRSYMQMKYEKASNGKFHFQKDLSAQY